jgi:hypothetical protein
VVAAALSSLPLHGDCISTLKPVSQPVVFPSHAAGPVVWNGSALGVAKIDTDIAHSLWFALYDSDLNQLTPDVQVADASLTGIVALTWNGTEFGVFYQSPLTLQLLLQRVSSAGQPVGAPIPIAANHNVSGHDEYDLTWDTTRQTYDVIHTVPNGRDAGLWVTTVKPDGTIVTDTLVTFFFASTATPRIAASNGNIGFVWVFDNGTAQPLFFAMLDRNDHITAVQAVSQTGRNPLLAASPTSFLVIDMAPLTSTSNELRSTRLDQNGNIVSPDATFLRASGVDIASRSLIWNPTLNEWALIYSDTNLGFNFAPGDTHLRRFHTPATVPPSDVIFAPDNLHRDFVALYPLTWTGVSYVGTIARTLSPTAGSDTWLVRYCPLIANASAPATTTVFTNVTFTAMPSGGTPDYLYSWDFGDLNTGSGAVVTHQYAHPGTYTVMLTVTDTAHATATTTLTIKVVVPRTRVARH